MKKQTLIIIATTPTIIALIILALYLITIYKNPGGGKSGAEGNYVSEIIDGDTFKMSNGEIVRLLCVDTPEKGKQGYEEAGSFLASLIWDKEVRLIRSNESEDKDKYGRSLRFVYVENSGEEIFVNKEIVDSGYGSLFIYENESCGEIS